MTLHFAQSLDGRIGLGQGAERAILSSEEGVVCAHAARSRNDAVLIGIETLLHDDPLLTLRGMPGTQPLRVVLDSQLRTPPSARLLGGFKQAGAVIVLGCAARAEPARRAALESRGATVLLTSADRDGRVLLSEGLELLSRRGVKRLLVEGGAKVLTSFLRHRLVDHAEVEIAPLWLGAQSTASVCDLGLAQLGQAARLARTEVERLGASVLVRGDVVYG